MYCLINSFTAISLQFHRGQDRYFKTQFEVGEETSDTVNPDWKLGPGTGAHSGSIPREAVRLDDWVDDPIDRIREGIRLRSCQHYRWRYVTNPACN